MLIVRLIRERRSVAALEFALIAPILITIMLGVYDLSQAVLIYNEVETAAHSIASSASTLATTNTTDGSTELTYAQIQFAASEMWGDIPSLRADYEDGTKSVTISSIVFEPTVTPSCTGANTPPPACFTPVVVWSAAYTGGDSGRAFQPVPAPGTPPTVWYTQTADGAGLSATSTTAGALSTTINNVAAPLRSCSNIASTSTATEIGSPNLNLIGSLYQSLPGNDAASDMTNLSTLNLTDNGPYTAPPAPILVVDVHLQYQPIIGLVINKPLDFWVSAAWPIRSSKFMIIGTTTAAMPYTPFTSLNSAGLPPAAANANAYCVNTTLTGALNTTPVASS